MYQKRPSNNSISEREEEEEEMINKTTTLICSEDLVSIEAWDIVSSRAFPVDNI